MMARERTGEVSVYTVHKLFPCRCQIRVLFLFESTVTLLLLLLVRFESDEIGRLAVRY